MERALLALGVALAAIGTWAGPSWAGAPFGPCAPPHRLHVADLDMVPDPAWHGAPVRQWIVTLRSDYNGECATRIIVRDGNELAGAEVEHRIRPGVHRYAIDVRPGYRFQRDDHCFVVLANIGNTEQRIDAARRFCARRGWTLK